MGIRRFAKLIILGQASLFSLFFYSFFITNNSPTLWFTMHFRATEPVGNVSLCNARMWGYHRTGNHLFMLAAMLYIGEITNRRVVMPSKGWNLDNAFDVDVIRVDNIDTELCPCATIQTPHYAFEKSLLDDTYINSLRESNRTLLLCGLSQSYIYPDAVSDTIRRIIKFKPAISHEADQFLQTITTADPPVKQVHRVGVHVRRGDFHSADSSWYGLTVVDADYLQRSFDYYKQRHPYVQFIVTSDDFNWTLASIPKVDSKSQIVVSNHSGAVDLAILSRCDSLIISTGSYGWWAAWLAKKPTVYYSAWPRKGSKMSNLFNSTQYFPPYWVGL